MNKWLTRFVLAATAAIVAMMPVKSNIPDADSVSGRFLSQSDDRVARPEPACGGWYGRPCNDYDEIGLPAVYGRAIEAKIAVWLDDWGSKGRGTMRRGLKRMGRYEGYIDAELAARNLPPSLRYLPLIEADYDLLAVSPEGAAGLWQLMPDTARWLGLEVNSLVDQRFDVQAATGAALDYLVVLQDRFQSWSLALAAYNAGPTRIERAIRRTAEADRATMPFSGISATGCPTRPGTSFPSSSRAFVWLTNSLSSGRRCRKRIRRSVSMSSGSRERRRRMSSPRLPASRKTKSGP